MNQMNRRSWSLRRRVLVVALLAAFLATGTMLLGASTPLSATSRSAASAPYNPADSAAVKAKQADPLSTANVLEEPKTYSVTDLGFFWPTRINEKGQVVGFLNNTPRIWLPEDAFGLEAGLHQPEAAGQAQFFDINDAGLIAGRMLTGGEECGELPAFWQAVEWTAVPLSTGDQEYGAATSVNDSGQIAGWVGCFDGALGDSVAGQKNDLAEEEPEIVPEAARWQGVAPQTLGSLGGDASLGYSINQNGQIVGASDIASGEEHAFLATGTAMSDLGVLPGATSSIALDINDAGQAVGGSLWPFIYLPAEAYGLDAGLHNLGSGVPGFTNGDALAINNDGRVVGDGANPNTHAFLWDKGVYYDLNDLIDDDDWQLLRAVDINEKGQIIGMGLHKGNQRAFLLDPLGSWTVMLYLDGDNDLSAWNGPIFNQLELAADNPDVNLILYWDSINDGDTGYYEVQHDTNLSVYANYTPDENTWPQGELDSGAPFTLSDFAIWAMDNYPADHYALILTDHGSGLGGGLVDDAGSTMNLPEMQLALNTIQQMTGEKIDVLYMDMCLMGLIEDAYQFRETVDYYVSSEYWQWSFASPYAQYISAIGPSSTPAEVAIDFAETYAGVAQPSGEPYTIAAADIAQLDELVTAANQLGAALDGNMVAVFSTLETLDQTVQRFDNEQPDGITLADTYIDLYDFADQASLTMSAHPDIVNAAEAVKSAVANYVLYESHGSSVDVNLDNSNGVSAFFPAMSSTFYQEDNYAFAVGANWPTSGAASLSGAQAGTWGSMVVNYIQTKDPGGPDDPTPPVPRPRLVPASFMTYLPVTSK